jgi:iron complex outermembrane receptor protein
MDFKFKYKYLNEKKIIITLLGFSALLHAQNTISGTVTDSSNPIIGVSIYVPELHKGTATDLRDAIP